MDTRILHTFVRAALVAAVLLGFTTAAHASDFYVNAATGDNADTGSSPDHAWKTISHALDAVNTGTIHIAPGIYDSVQGEVFPFLLMFHDDIQLVGDGGSAVTIIDGRYTPLIIRDTRAYHSGFAGQQTAIVGLTLRNAQTGLLLGSSWADVHLTCSDVRIENMTSFGLMITSSFQGPMPGGNVQAQFNHVAVVDCRGAVSVSSSGDLLGTSQMNVTFADSVLAHNLSEGVRAVHGQGENASLVFLRSRITDNGRGGVLVQQTQESNSGGVSDTRLEDCVVTQNDGPGVRAAYTGMWTPPYTTSSITTSILRCTIADNVGTGLDVATSVIDPTRVHTTLTGSILYGNGIDVLDHVTQPSIVDPSFCDVGQGNFAGINGNISANPLFRSPAMGNYRLVWHSPCVDVGQPRTPVGALDFAGHARSTDGNLDTIERSDMGAFEFEPLNLVTTVHAGGPCTLELWGPPGGTTSLYFARGLPLPTPVMTPFGESDLGSSRYLGMANVGSGPPTQRTFQIPNNPVYVGVTITIQGLTTSSVLTPPLAYTNAVTFTIAP